MNILFPFCFFQRIILKLQQNKLWLPVTVTPDVWNQVSIEIDIYNIKTAIDQKVKSSHGFSPPWNRENLWPSKNLSAIFQLFLKDHFIVAVSLQMVSKYPSKLIIAREQGVRVPGFWRLHIDRAIIFSIIKTIRSLKVFAPFNV